MDKNPHTLKAFDDERNELRALISRMGELAEAATRDALRCVIERDVDSAAHIVRQDHILDELESEAERQAMQMIALRTPLADDLREVIAALKISSVVERIGDYAKNIAKRVPLIEPTGATVPVSLLPEMGRIAIELVHDALDAFIERDAIKAAQVCASDRLVDDFYTGMFRTLLTYMMENPHNIGPAAHLLFVAKNIERIGDHATNIAEVVYFATTGERLGNRPRGGDALAP